VHKLAIVLAAAKRNTLRIELEDLVEAEATITSLEGDMLKVFNSIGVAEEASKSQAILTLVRAHKKITYKKLWQICFITMKPEVFRDGVKAIIEAGYVKLLNEKGEQVLEALTPEIAE
jgi:hypothetical protein